jgi:hypothetical protein
VTLREQQSRFAGLVAALILEAQRMGFAVTLGEAYRSPEEAARLAKLGKGIVKSLHCQRLAIDLNLFKDGQYLRSTDSHRPLGEWWEQQDPCCRWGGHFTRADGNHYEFKP